MSLGNVVDLLCSQAWAMHEPTLLALRNIVFRHEEGQRLSAEDAAQAVRDAGGVPWRTPRSGGVTSDGIATIAIQGVIARRANMVNGSSQPKGTSIEQIDAELSRALEDDAVRAIVLDIDSPGGAVGGVSEFAQRVRTSPKPVFALADGMAASAAYWIGSAAQRMVATRASAVGSIGVYAVMDDMHRRFESAGVHSTLVASGPRKGAGTPGTNVTEEHIASLRETIDAYAKVFFGDVQSARALTAEQLAAVTTGQVWIGEQAVSLGLVDAIASRDEFLRSVSASIETSPPAAPEPQRNPKAAETMDIKNLDAATLRAERPDLVSEITKAAADAAVNAERERIGAIMRNAGKAGIDAETVGKAISEGWSREQAAERFLDIAAERKEARLDAVRVAAGKADESVTEEAQPKPAANEVSQMPLGVERFKAEFAADPKLRAEFADEATYVAFRKSETGVVSFG